MDKNQLALTPPMGWNSWDCYGASVTEEILLGNARYMAEHMKDFGWEYVVCDIQWYEPQAKSTEYNDFFPLEMDGYSRLIPAVNRFPSSKDGRGFAPIAEQIHGMGLKFGIHIMRGIPRQAVHGATPIKGCGRTARDIAQKFSLCPWNTDMYGVNPDAEGAQDYYDSLFELYASWGVDFVKVDDISNTEFKPHDSYSARREIEMIRAAINKCGRGMVLSLSPGPAPLSEAEHLRQNANMWRMTGDFWDSWQQLYMMFERCNQWSPHVSEGCWPDCDMLPLGRIGVNTPGYDQAARFTNFSREEQRTMLSLWCMFRFPLMVGAELRDNDDFTLSLLTNREILEMHGGSSGAKQVWRSEGTVVWCSRHKDGDVYMAVFNISDGETAPDLPLTLAGIYGSAAVRDLWEGRELGVMERRIRMNLVAHDAKVFRLTAK
ncbi:MAG: glycoside hydrolase family 27 protein [Oscillospiraceae bacterium]